MIQNRDLFDQNVPEAFQRKLLKLVLECTRGASEHCYGTFSSPQAKDVSGVYRRGMIEDQLPGMKALFPSIDVSGRRYRRKRGQKTGHFHEITCGLVKITQSCIAFQDKVPREAKFRLTLATNGQGDLFEESETETEQAKYLYSILTYWIDTESENRSLPAFVRVQFPNKNCTQYVDEGIDLMGKFPDLVAEYVPQPNAKAAVTQKPSRSKEASA